MKKRQKRLESLPGRQVHVVERGEKANSDWEKCEIGKTLEFKAAALATYFFAKWEPVVVDAFLLAAAVEYCDKSERRPSLGWGREFHLLIPVHDYELWSKDEISTSLHDALELLTGDRWIIKFYKRKKPADSPQQALFNLPMKIEAVMPFSDGLDSRAVSALMHREYGEKLVHVRLGTKSDDSPKANNGKPLPFAPMPYKVKGKKGDFRESSARSRGFKFALLSGLAAYLSKAKKVIVPESGQGALGPALIPVGQAYQDFRNHPVFTNYMSAFLKALLNYDVVYDFPRIWKTKGQTLKDFIKIQPENEDWRTTRSCWQDNRQASVDGERRQCGICAACMLRRMSIHAAGLNERKDTYIWETLQTAKFESGAAKDFKAITERKREYAIAGALHLDHLARVRTSKLARSAKELSISQLAKALGLSEKETTAQLDRMLMQHETEWNNFRNSLGSNSFVLNWVGSKQ